MRLADARVISDADLVAIKLFSAVCRFFSDCCFFNSVMLLIPLDCGVGVFFFPLDDDLGDDLLTAPFLVLGSVWVLRVRFVLAFACADFLRVLVADFPDFSMLLVAMT